MKKSYSVSYGIGKAKYCVHFHDGFKKHSDNSPFFDCRVFSNKKNMNSFIIQLESEGYVK